MEMGNTFSLSRWCAGSGSIQLWWPPTPPPCLNSGHLIGMQVLVRFNCGGLQHLLYILILAVSTLI